MSNNRESTTANQPLGTNTQSLHNAWQGWRQRGARCRDRHPLCSTRPPDPEKGSVLSIRLICCIGEQNMSNCASFVPFDGIYVTYLCRKNKNEVQSADKKVKKSPIRFRKTTNNCSTRQLHLTVVLPATCSFEQGPPPRPCERERSEARSNPEKTTRLIHCAQKMDYRAAPAARNDAGKLFV